LRCDARSQPCEIGVWGSTVPLKTISSPSGSNIRTVRKRSASSVADETNSFAAKGPDHSVSSSNGGVQNSTPSPAALYATDDDSAGAAS
jgi:hypothetical protein